MTKKAVCTIENTVHLHKEVTGDSPFGTGGKDTADIKKQILRALVDLNFARENIIALTAYAYHETHGDVHVAILLYDITPTAEKTIKHGYEGSDAGAV